MDSYLLKATSSNQEEVSLKTKEDNKHTAEEERCVREAALDETLKETFPASDPPSTIPNPYEDEALERRMSPHC